MFTCKHRMPYVVWRLRDSATIPEAASEALYRPLLWTDIDHDGTIDDAGSALLLH